MQIPKRTKLLRFLSHGGPYQAQEGAGPGGFPTDLQRTPGYPAFLALVNAPRGISSPRTSVVHRSVHRQTIEGDQCLTVLRRIRLDDWN